MSTPAEPLPANRVVAAAVILACVTVAACALVAVAYMLGWVGQREARKVAAASTPAAQQAAIASTADGLTPGETLVEPATVDSRPPILFPTYSQPTPPRPAPPASAVDPPTGVPRSPYLTPRPAAPAAAPPVPAEAAPPMPPRPLRSEPPREEPRYAEEVRPPREERRQGSRFCANCAVVTAVSQYVDEWEVHLRFSDGTRRRIHYDRPPPVARGDRVFFENGRLFLE
jgi:hypothetical protein